MFTPYHMQMNLLGFQGHGVKGHGHMTSSRTVNLFMQYLSRKFKDLHKIKHGNSLLHEDELIKFPRLLGQRSRSHKVIQEMRYHSKLRVIDNSNMNINNIISNMNQHVLQKYVSYYSCPFHDSHTKTFPIMKKISKHFVTTYNRDIIQRLLLLSFQDLFNGTKYILV